MSFQGKIVSHDAQTQVGLIKPTGAAQSVMFLEGDIENRGEVSVPLVGRTVSFEVVQTDRGPVAVSINFIRGGIVRPSDWLAATLAPVLTIAATFIFQLEFEWSLIVSYLVAINMVAFLMLACQSSRPYSSTTNPADIAQFVLALAGGAAATFVGSVMFPSKWYHQAARFVLLVMVVLHCFALKTIDPTLLSKETFQHLLHTKKGS